MQKGLQKLKLAKRLKQLRQDIRSISIKGLEKIKLAKEIKNVRSKIRGKAVGANSTSRLEKLINGDYNNLSPLEFIDLVTKIEKETGEFEQVKPPVIEYAKKNLAAQK